MLLIGQILHELDIRDGLIFRVLGIELGEYICVLAQVRIPGAVRLEGISGSFCPAMNGVLQANGGFKIVMDITRIFDAEKVSTDIGANEIFAVRVLPCEPLLSIQRHWARRLVLDGNNRRSMAAEPSTHEHRDQECIFSLWSHTCLDTAGSTFEPKSGSESHLCGFAGVLWTTRPFLFLRLFLRYVSFRGDSTPKAPTFR